MTLMHLVFLVLEAIENNWLIPLQDLAQRLDMQELIYSTSMHLSCALVNFLLNVNPSEHDKCSEGCPEASICIPYSFKQLVDVRHSDVLTCIHQISG